MPYTDTPVDLERLLALLGEKDWTGADLARKAGLSQPTVWSLLNGRTKMPKAATLIAVANALGVPLREILRQRPGKKAEADLAEAMSVTFSALDPRDQHAILTAARSLLSRPKR